MSKRREQSRLENLQLTHDRILGGRAPPRGGTIRKELVEKPFVGGLDQLEVSPGSRSDRSGIEAGRDTIEARVEGTHLMQSRHVRRKQVLVHRLTLTPEIRLGQNDELVPIVHLRHGLVLRSGVPVAQDHDGYRGRDHGDRCDDSEGDAPPPEGLTPSLHSP